MWFALCMCIGTDNRRESHISAGSCLGKVFLLFMAWEDRETKQPDSHSLTLGPYLCSVG